MKTLADVIQAVVNSTDVNPAVDVAMTIRFGSAIPEIGFEPIPYTSNIQSALDFLKRWEPEPAIRIVEVDGGWRVSTYKTGGQQYLAYHSNIILAVLLLGLRHAQKQVAKPLQ